MAALVADYGDSEDDSDAESEAVEDGRELSSTSAQPLVSSLPKKGINFFQEGDIDSSSSSEDEQRRGKAEECGTKGDNSDRLPNPMADRLPAPGLGDLKDSESVFRNKFELAEKAKNSILEQHVKMTEARKQAKRNVCFKFQKGKCKFGKNCKFSHDRGSELVVNSTKQEEEKAKSGTEVDSGFGSAGRSVYLNPSAAYGDPLPPLDREDDDSYMAGMKKKRRAGLSEHLVPSKKAMSSLDRQRLHERPWTMKK